MILFFICCGEDLPKETISQEEPSFVARVQTPRVNEGAPIHLTMTLSYPPQVEPVMVEPPTATGMVVSLLEGPLVEQLGVQDRQRWDYSLSAPAGSYVIYPGTAHLGDAPPITATPIFVDIAVQGPTSELSEVVIPPKPPETIEWRWPLIVGTLGIGVFGLLFWVYRRREKPHLDPTKVAAEAWQTVKLNPSSEHHLAVELSLIVRRCLSDILNEPVLMTLSPSELQDWLSNSKDGLAGSGEIAKLLLALDGFKFGNQGGGSDWWQIQESIFQSILTTHSPPEQQ